VVIGAVVILAGQHISPEPVYQACRSLLFISDDW
jgi:hypothetical protein